jgi:hypothetical protein
MTDTTNTTAPVFTPSYDEDSFYQRRLEVLDFAKAHNGVVTMGDADNSYFIAIPVDVTVPTYDEVTGESGDADERRVIIHDVSTLRNEQSRIVLSEAEGRAVLAALTEFYC